MTKPKIYEADVTEFIDDPVNPNQGTEHGERLLDVSLEETGVGRGVVIDQNNVLVAGNKARAAAYRAGFKKAVVVEHDGDTLVVSKRTDFNLNDPDPNNPARVYSYLDNQTALESISFDPEVLKTFQEQGMSFDKIFQDWQIDEILEDGEEVDNSGADTEPQIDKADELRQEWQTELGQMWQLGKHRLVCGDCTDKAVVDRVMEGDIASLILTDVPYGISQESNGLRNLDYGDWDKKTAKDTAYKAIEQFRLVPTIVTFCRDNQISHFWDMFSERSRRSLCWIKPNPTVMNGQHLFLPSLEFAFYGKRPSAYFNGHCELSYWQGAPDINRNHPNQKPLELFEWILGLCCPTNEITIDPFVGSGTTIIACENLNRQCRAIEIAPSYVAVCLQRYFDHTGDKPVLLEAI